MEQLLFEARKLVQSISSGVEDPEGHHPNLTIPEKWAHVPTMDQYMDIQDIPKKGKGFVAKQNLPVGTVLLVTKPIAMVLDSEDEDSDDENDAPVAGKKEMSRPGEDHEFEDMEDDNEYMEDFDGENEENEGPNDAGAADDKDPRINELLLLEVLDQLDLDPHIWENCLSKLFPRTDQEVAQLPAWVCHDDDIFVEIENGVKALEQKHAVLRPYVKDISKRLPLIIRYNILSIETCPELLSYPGPEGFSKLSGVGLYHLPSFFNHSRKPNCSRYAIGDVMFFVTNQDISAGSEVCISYIEHDILCESAYRRNLMLSMDFHDEPNDVDTMDHTDIDLQAEKEGPDMPVVDCDVQNELMSMNALERLPYIDDLLAQATGQKSPENEDTRTSMMSLPPSAGSAGDMEASTPTFDAPSKAGTTPPANYVWFQCDVQNLLILKAITFEGLGQSEQALVLWEKAIKFCDTKMPPLDENGIVTRVQAALTAWHLGDITRAQHHAAVALQTHNLLFGNGGVHFFRIRLGPDLRLPIRPHHDRAEMMNGRGNDAVTALWPYT